MKYAYLVIAHNEFEVLQKLVECLDDERNDIFVHFDKKVKSPPQLFVRYSNLILCEKRIDTRWGNVSQIETEYVLFEEALKHGEYSRYILLSGTHLPLKNQDQIHSWIEERSGLEIMSPVRNDNFQTDQKVRRYNLFTRLFAASINAQHAWRLCIEFQRRLGIHRNSNRHYSISSNWVCLTPCAVKCLLNQKKHVLKEFRYSFCGDEFFVRSILERNGFIDKILLTDRFLYCDFGDGANPRILTINDFGTLIESNCLFARKFSWSQPDIIERVFETIKTHVQ